MSILQGKVAIVTGGGSGIGRGIALALAREGVSLVICGRRAEKLAESARLIRGTGGDVLTVPADVSVTDDVDQLVQATLELYGRIDILVNNAAIGDSEPVHQAPPELWDQVMDINLRGPYLVTHKVLPHMRAQRSGHILMISSESGIEYYTGDAVYGTSKHALNAFAEYVQRENQDLNIRVNTICPGMVVTEMTENSPDLDHSKCLLPEDIADLALWLLTRRPNIKIGTPILIQTMLNPWE